jgi:UDP-N-acetylglucosamine 2-epimerase (non-hydrolysing)
MITGSLMTTGIHGILNQDNKTPGPIVMVLGIRPDVIRASIILRELRASLGSNFKLIWSGQHYSENLKDVFFNELEVEKPDIELNIEGHSDAELVASTILKLSKVFQEIKPSVAVFLGDTNTVTGTIAAGQLNIPIVHIEGCMRSYDWRMPEEKYRTIADHLSDYIYAYLDSYKAQGVAEGIPDSNIIVTGNPIVDVLKEYFLSGKLRMNEVNFNLLLQNKYKILNENYLVMTCHRRENVENENSLKKILELASSFDKKIIFPAGYRTQKQIKLFKLSVPKNVVMVDPVGYLELLEIIFASKGVLTDSGTVIEEAAILGIPAIQMRKSTERPQVYEFGSAVKFDPNSNSLPIEAINKFSKIKAGSWQHSFGDGKASYRIVEDLVSRFKSENFNGHLPKKYEPFSTLSFRE